MPIGLRNVKTYGTIKGGVEIPRRYRNSTQAVYEYMKFVLIDKDENIMVPVHVFDLKLVTFNKAFKGLFVVGTNVKRSTHNVSGSTDNYKVAHYTSLECLKMIVDDGRILANVGIYGKGAYVTTITRNFKGGLQAV